MIGMCEMVKFCGCASRIFIAYNNDWARVEEGVMSCEQTCIQHWLTYMTSSVNLFGWKCKGFPLCWCSCCFSLLSYSKQPCTKTLRELNISNSQLGGNGLYMLKLGLLGWPIALWQNLVSLVREVLGSGNPQSQLWWASKLPSLAH